LASNSFELRWRHSFFSDATRHRCAASREELRHRQQKNKVDRRPFPKQQRCESSRRTARWRVICYLTRRTNVTGVTTCRARHAIIAIGPVRWHESSTRRTVGFCHSVSALSITTWPPHLDDVSDSTTFPTFMEFMPNENADVSTHNAAW